MRKSLFKAAAIALAVGIIIAFICMLVKPKVTVTDKDPIKVINNRGDILVKTSTGIVTIKETTGKHKVGAYLGSKVGYNYELFRIGDFNLSIGLTSDGSLATIGYSLNKYIEVQIGTSGLLGISGRVL